MYRHPATSENLDILRERGVMVVGPGTGGLACLDIGEGRMVEPEEIVEIALSVLAGGSLAGKSVLVTAGGTREPVDAIRFLGNRSSGKMGYAVAREAARRGASVTLVSAPTLLPVPAGMECRRVETAQEMGEEVNALAGTNDIVIMAAAVADFRPTVRREGKVKKEAAELQIGLERTPDILEGLGQSKRPGQLLVGFSAETENVVENAGEKLRRKNLDLIVANDVGLAGAGFESDQNRGYLIDAAGVEELALMSKEEMARRIIDRVVSLLPGN
jgi:phosphopantothenoylcysteine decarboxylase/phosphopantothenate--cysteine ligase